MANRLDGKVALITGGARGQGAEHGRLFAEEGARVVLGDVLDDEGEELVEVLAAEDRDVSYVHLDVADEESWKGAIAFIEERLGALHVLINNAGVLGTMKGVADEDRSQWDRAVAINQTGVMLGMKHSIPLLKRAGGGSIINTSSIWGTVGTEEYVAYQATKGAVLQLTRSAALTYAGDGIRVNSVSPGMVMTPMLADEPEEGIAEVERITPLGRGAEPREVSYGMLFLASDESSYVTGINMPVDGGFLAQ